MFSSRLKELRLESGLTQKQFADKIGLDAHNVGDWEREKCEPSIFWLNKIADSFNVSVDYLVGREDDFDNVVVSAPKGNVSPADEKLLKDFYSLGPFEQEYIRGQIQALLNTSREVIKK